MDLEQLIAAASVITGPNQQILEATLALLVGLMQQLQSIRSRRVALCNQFFMHEAARQRRLRRRVSHHRAIFLRLAQESRFRRWWVYPRSTDWWDNCAQIVWEDEQWLGKFRLSKATFMWLVDTLRHRLQRQVTNMRRPVSPEERVAVTLWWLAHTIRYVDLSKLFGLARSTISGIVAEVCLVIQEELMGEIIRLDSPERAMLGFAEKGFPHCVGAVDACHVPIRTPPHSAGDCTNRKDNFTVLFQGVCDDRGRFFHVNVGESGKSHDGHVSRASNLVRGMDVGVFIPRNPTISVDGVRIPPLILGDAAYPVRSWLVTPFTGALTPEQAEFNRVHSQARNVVERAFGRLKARWRCLTVKMPLNEANIKRAIVACVILHNICEDRGHDLPTDLTVEPAPAPGAIGTLYPPGRQEDDGNKEEGERVRAAIMRWMRNHHGH